MVRAGRPFARQRRAAARRRATATCRPMPRWCSPRPRAKIRARLRARSPRCSRPTRHRLRRGRGPGLHQSAADRRFLAGPASPLMLDEGLDFGRSTMGGGQDGERRICLGQPDRPDACRPLPRRGRRRRARQSARLRGLSASPRNTTSTTPARRSTCSRAR